MKFVQPIREREKIEDIKAVLLKQGLRNYMLFVLGINTGLRIGDILKLQVKDVKDKTHITIKEQKSKKEKRFKINDALKNEIEKHTKYMRDEEYLFQSQKGENKPITRVQAYRILKNAAQKVQCAEGPN